MTLRHSMESYTCSTYMKVAVAIHGSEISTSLGGPSVRAPQTVAQLRYLGVDAELKTSSGFFSDAFDVIHVFNVWQPPTCEILLRQAEKNNRPSVLSPIFLDLSERIFFHDKLLYILRNSHTPHSLNKHLENLREEINKANLEEKQEHVLGYFSKINYLMTYPDHLILLSEHEKKELLAIGVNHDSVSVVKNPVDFNRFTHADPQLFADKFGVTVNDYVLCVGRIESRKNQALLAYALCNTGITLVFIGHEPDANYAQLVKKWAGKNTVFVGRLSPQSALLASAFAGARVFCLPSFSEGAPLAALEAAAAGCSMVLSNRSSEQEYFGDLARYIDPCNPDDIREKILEAYEDKNFPAKKKKLQELIQKEYNWKKYAQDTLKAYRLAQKKHAKKMALKPTPKNKKVFIDLTTLANHHGPATGMARVEKMLAHELIQNTRLDIHYVIWNYLYQKFIYVDKHEIDTDQIKLLTDKLGEMFFKNSKVSAVFSEVNFESGDMLLVFGSAWMRNPCYLASLWNLKSAKEILLITTVYDVAQYVCKEFYQDTVSSEFLTHCKKLIEISDRVFTCSNHSAKDILMFCQEICIPIPPITLFYLGDEHENFSHDNNLLEEAAQIIGDILVEHSLSVERLAFMEMGKALYCNSKNNQSSTLMDYFLAGWGNLEETGIWMVGTLSLFACQLSHIPRIPIILKINAFPFSVTENKPLKVTVVVNNTVLVTWCFQKGWQTKFLLIEPFLFTHSSSLKIEFHTQNPTSPANLRKSEDKRLLGLRVQDIALEYCTNLILDQWTKTSVSNQRNCNEWILHLRKQTQMSKKIWVTFELEISAPTELIIEINKTTFASVHLRCPNSGPRALLYTLSDPTDSFIIFRAHIVQGSTIRIKRFGVFTVLPSEVLDLALKTHTLSHQKQLNHIPYTDAVPYLDMNQPLSINQSNPTLSGFLGSWYAPEANGTWMGMNTASIHVKPTGKINGSLIIYLEFEIYFPLLQSNTDLMVKIGSHEPFHLFKKTTETKKTAPINSLFHQQWTIPTDIALYEGVLSLTFYSSTTIAPIYFGQNSDKRQLSLKLIRLNVSSPIENNNQMIKEKVKAKIKSKYFQFKQKKVKNRCLLWFLAPSS